MNDGSATLIRGNALSLPLPDNSVDLIVTSPPYFGLRSYQDGGQHYDGQIGDEATPTEFIDALINATSEMMRVLKPSGSIWVNLGDKYANKSLLAIPWRYAIRCVDELGLIMRAEVIWSKPNGLPESVTDRVRRSHEQWFHFTKSGTYFSAVDEIREPHIFGHKGATWEERKQNGDLRYSPDAGHAKGSMAGNPLGKLPGSVWSIPTEPLQIPDELGVDHFAAFPTEWPRRIITGWSPDQSTVLDPFCGTGTTVAVAKALGRHGIGIDMSSDYLKLANWRCHQDGYTRIARKLAGKGHTVTPPPAQHPTLFGDHQ